MERQTMKKRLIALMLVLAGGVMAAAPLNAVVVDFNGTCGTLNNCNILLNTADFFTNSSVPFDNNGMRFTSRIQSTFVDYGPGSTNPASPPGAWKWVGIQNGGTVPGYLSPFGCFIPPNAYGPGFPGPCFWNMHRPRAALIRRRIGYSSGWHTDAAYATDDTEEVLVLQVNAGFGLIDFYQAPSAGLPTTFANNVVTINAVDGLRFDLQSLEIGEGIAHPLNGTYAASQVDFTGTVCCGGGTLNQSITLDGVFDGKGPGADFQPESFVGWNNLTKVEMDATAGIDVRSYVLDDITVHRPCGDGDVDPGEECDDGDPGNLAQCTPAGPTAVNCNSPATIVPSDPAATYTATAVDNCAGATVAITGHECFKVKKDGSHEPKDCVVDINGADFTILESSGVCTHIVWTAVPTDAASNVGSPVECEVLVAHPHDKKSCL